MRKTNSIRLDDACEKMEERDLLMGSAFNVFGVPQFAPTASFSNFNGDNDGFRAFGGFGFGQPGLSQLSAQTGLIRTGGPGPVPNGSGLGSFGFGNSFGGQPAALSLRPGFNFGNFGGSDGGGRFFFGNGTGLPTGFSNFGNFGGSDGGGFFFGNGARVPTNFSNFGNFGGSDGGGFFFANNGAALASGFQNFGNFGGSDGGGFFFGGGNRLPTNFGNFGNFGGSDGGGFFFGGGIPTALPSSVSSFGATPFASSVPASSPFVFNNGFNSTNGFVAGNNAGFGTSPLTFSNPFRIGDGDGRFFAGGTSFNNAGGLAPSFFSQGNFGDGDFNGFFGGGSFGTRFI